MTDRPVGERLRRIASVSPQGQKRILAIVQPVVYRLRVGSFRGATWVDERNGIVWLCAVHRREQDSDDDAYAWFADLHAKGRLLPSEDKRHQAVSGYWQTHATLQRWCRLRSYLDSALAHGLTALDAITLALEGHPWLPPVAVAAAA